MSENSNDVHHGGDFPYDEEAYPETKVIYTTDENPDAWYDSNQDVYDTGEYDFSLDNMIDDYASQYAYNNLPSGHKYGDWVAKSDYDGLYNGFIDVSEVSRDTISSLYHYSQQLSVLTHEKETTIEKMRLQMNQYVNEDNAAASFNESRKRELDEREKSIENEKMKNKTLLYGAIGLAAILAIVSTIFFFMWTGARNDSASEAQKGSAHQERIAELESSLQSSRTDATNLQSKNSELQSKVDAANKKSEDTQKALEEIRKQSDEKDKEIDKLNEDIARMENQRPETTTVTETPESNTIVDTTTVTRTAPPVTETFGEVVE